MAVSAHDVARELRRRMPSLGITKLHKLLYYCQAWYVTWTDDALFQERIEAWDNGPVVADLWHDENKHRKPPAPQPLTDSMLVTIDYVVARYGRLSPRELIDLTHAEAPWNMAYEPDANIELDLGALETYFSRDSEQADVRAQAALLSRDELRKVVEAVSVAAGPVIDDSAELADLLKSL